MYHRLFSPTFDYASVGLRRIMIARIGPFVIQFVAFNISNPICYCVGTVSGLTTELTLVIYARCTRSNWFRNTPVAT
ncbi:hypothetical protein CW304_26285 [Bacillus sp. UFRGS-B20]|nr:hypothetical protein CW304_26285 [Bacillus sp. UFRGS-B20]